MPRRPRLVTRLEVRFRNGQRFDRAFTLDVGMGGLFVQVENPPAVGDWLEIVFLIERVDGRRPVHCIGQVLRVQRKPIQEEGAAGAAIEFRAFQSGLEDLRSFLAQDLGCSPEELGHPPLTHQLPIEFTTKADFDVVDEPARAPKAGGE